MKELSEKKKQKLLEELQSGRVSDEKSLAIFTMIEEMKDELEVVEQKVEQAVDQVEAAKLDLPKVLESVRGPQGDKGDKDKRDNVNREKSTTNDLREDRASNDKRRGGSLKYRNHKDKDKRKKSKNVSLKSKRN
jgi:hypothetical protein